MPIHEYECDNCKAKFDQLRIFGEDVSTAQCISCHYLARKVWSVPQVRQDLTPHYSEQLGTYIGSRQQEAKAIKDIYERSEGKINVDWH